LKKKNVIQVKKWATVKGLTIDFRVPNLILPDSTIDAAVDAVNQIVNDYAPPYNLMVSGGIDSQAMLYAWKLSNHTFNAISFVYNEGMNEHDLVQLKEFAKRENIDITYFSLDFLNFAKNEYDSIAVKYQCSSPQISTHIKFTQIVGGTCVFSGNFLHRRGAALTHAVLGLYRYSLSAEGKNTVPYFFLYTPELAYSLRKYRTKCSEGTQDEKIDLYQQAGFPIIPQPQKFTGFEKLKDYYDEHYGYVVKDKSKIRYMRRPSHRAFDWILRYPYEEKFKHYGVHRYLLNP